MPIGYLGIVGGVLQVSHGAEVLDVSHGPVQAIETKQRYDTGLYYPLYDWMARYRTPARDRIGARELIVRTCVRACGERVNRTIGRARS